ncbi:MAG: SMC family ATPase, partial [Nocardioides sp.]
EHAHDQKVRDLETRLTALVARSGDRPVPDLTSHAAQIESDLQACEQLVARGPEATAALAVAEAELSALERRLREQAGELARCQAQQQHLSADASRLRAELGELVDHDLAVVAAGHEHTARLINEARTAHEQAAASAAACLDARRAMVDAAEDAGFDTVHTAVAAALDREVLTSLAARITHHEQRLAVVREVLASPDVVSATALPAPDVDGLSQAHDAALAAHTSAATAADLAAARRRRIGELTDQLDGALHAWWPVRDELTLTAGLASFVDGKSADNTLRMRLSAYVLAYRLTQVVAAANQRLARMSDQRYSLEHTGRRGAGETRGGLSLLVRDDWSGESRDPATLSGGETFVVSLALALGLADVITHESGGAALDTLFVDEGFGSLDADTLDDVMDTLDALRDGGRVVGVVSHVAEMRDRIPTQLVVTKSRTGSRVDVRR